MHVIPKYEPGVVLFSRSGTVTRYGSMKSALAALGYRWIQENVGTEFSDRFYRESSWTWALCGHILRTDYGTPLTAADFTAYRQPAARKWWHSQEYCGYGPVPRTRKHRGGGHYFRRMRTMNERRAAALVVHEDGEVAARPSRNCKGLPNNWDDYPCGAREDRNWKRQRKTRWKSVDDFR